MMKSSGLILVLLLSASANAARILGVIPTPSYSHQIPFQPIFRELSLRGHQVTVITPNPQKDPLLTNLTEIDLSSSYDIVKNINIREVVEKNFYSIFSFMINISVNITENTLNHPEVRAMIRNESEHFDLVMLEMLAPGTQAFPIRFGCPFIGMSPMDIQNGVYANLGNPIDPVQYPDFNLDVTVPFTNMTIWERLISLVYYYFQQIFHYYIMAPIMHLTLKKHFGENFTSYTAIERNISLLFVNTDLALHPIRPLLPNVVRIGGGLHLKKPKPLPKELKALMDGAQQGVIYCSFGSNVKSTDLTVKTREIILKTFAELPYLVLWKFEMDDLIKTPKNVVTSKWFSQQDVLGHSNVVLFITQGGLQSIEEAIHNAVPIIGVPFMGDQPKNVKVLVYKGMGLSLDYKQLTQETFKDAILEVIKNPRYRNQVKNISKLIRDEPMTGLERAVWWTEYVIRHKGALHLRSLEVPFYQYYLLDVIGFLVAIVLGVAYSVVKMSKYAVLIFKYYSVNQKLKTQ